MKTRNMCRPHQLVGYSSTLLLKILVALLAFSASSSVLAAEVELVVYWPADANQNTITIETTSGGFVAGPFTSGGGTAYNTTVGPITLNDGQNYVVRMNDSANNGWGSAPIDGGGTARPSVTVISDGVEVGNGTHLSGGNSSFTFPATSHTEAPTGTQSCTAFTGSWSGSGNVWSASTSGGMNATITLGASSGASWSGSTNGALNTINTFSESSARGQTSFSTAYYWDTSTTSASDAAGANAANGTVRLDFTSGPILNPVIHFDRFGGTGGLISLPAANSSEWLLTTPGASITRLAGAPHFRTVGNRIFRDTTSALNSASSFESSLDPAAGTAAGSVMVEGIHSQLDFSLTGIGTEGGGADGIEIVLCGSLAPPIDFSDAPISGTAPNGTDSNTYGEASHTIVSGMYLGAGEPDAELSNQATATADGDDLADSDDEDGVVIPPLTLGVANIIEVTVAGTGGKLQGWIDWNGDGDFNDPVEQLLTNVTDNGLGDIDLTPGKIAFTVTPALGGFTGTTYARFRWSSESDVASTGLASNGEVEDYAVTVARAPESINCGTEVGSAGGSGYATSGAGLYLNEIFWLDWSCGGETKFLAGDTITKSWEVGNGLTVTATVSNITQDISPYNSGDWSGDFFDDYYGGVNPVGLANQLRIDANFDVSFTTTLNGVTIPSDIVIADMEDLDAQEVTTITANGDSFQTLDASGSIKAAFGGGTGAHTLTLSDPDHPGGGTVVAMSRGATTINIDIGARGISATGFGVMLPFDYGDSPISTTASHYLRPSATGGSQPTTATVAADLTLATITYGDETYLGSTRADAEPSSYSGAAATGDDLAGTDDEDGISAFPILSVGATSYELPGSNITTSGTGTLHGWIDFNKNGAFESTEYASIEYTSTTIANDPATKLSWTTLGTMTAGTTFARFRFTSDTLTDDTGTTTIDERSAGSASNGEVEDYVVTILANDYGDAPGYGDAYHGTDGVTYLGTAPDVETASKTTNGDASDDANDDGVFTDAALTTGLQGTSLKPEDSTTLYIPVTGSGKLYAWIDWDANGVFGNNSNELIANGVAGTDETLIVSARIPIAANLGTTYARFRFSSDAALTEPTGAASDGEVEDYQVTIANTATTPTAPAIAYCSNTWTLDGGVYNTTTSQGVAISASTTAEAGAAWSFAPNDALNTSGNFSFAALNGSPSLSTVFTWDTAPEDGRLANAADDDATGTLTFSFAVPVKNPILHIDRQGGYGSSTAASPQGLSNSSIITPNAANASASFTRLAGTTHFEVTSNSIQRTPNETMQDTGVTGASGTDSTLYTAMGSVQVNGTFNSLSLDLNGVGVEGAGADGIEFVICAEPYDYGDAPASYGEAAHKIPDTPVVYLGDVAPDHEPQIQHAANGGSDGAGDDLNGSDDEDAYEKLPAVWTSQSSYRLKLACSDQGAYVAGWVDFNQNNQFDAGERNTDYPTQCNSSGNVTLNWTGLSGLSTGSTYARLRIGSDTDEVSTATGTASDGEVEDYPIVLQAPGTAPGACNGELNWLNLAGQPAYPAANWNVNWADRGLNATLGFSTTMTGSNDKWTSTSASVFTESNFINRFGSPGYALGLNHPDDLSGTGSTIANIGFDTPLPANTYMVVRDIDATNESITFSNNSLGSLPAPSLWETQSTTELNANDVAWNNPSLFAAWDAAGQQLVTLSDGPNNDQEAYVWPVAGLTDIRVTYQTYAGSANVGFVSCIPQDYGDAPNTYLTTKAATGPQHGIINGVHLGTNTPDTDSDGQPSADANGDGADEDGISSLPTLTSSDRSFSTTVSASNDTANPATLVGWIDFDKNGTLDADEAAIRTIAAGSSNASYTLNWSNIPVDIQTGTSYLRLRLTTDSLSNREPGGAKRDGEIEDYLINITTAGVSVSGRVFNDANVDAINDSGEIGVTQLPVVLYDKANNVCVSTRTDGSGNYAFKDVAPGTYQVYEASRESVPTPGQCGPANAKDPSSYRSTTNNARDEFTVTTSDITGQDFGDVKLPVFEPDNSGQILPGNVLFYAHKFSTPATGSVSVTSVSSTNRSSGWSSIIYRDANCDGTLNQSDGSLPLGTSSLAVNANDTVCLINKVYAPSNVAANDQYIQNITADFDYGNAIAGDLALKVRDATTAKQVQAPALSATPEVVAEPVTPVQAPVAATPTTPYIPEIPEAPAQAPVAATPVTPAVGPSRLELRKTVKNITQGTAETSTVNSAEPGNTLEYRVYYSNSGTGPVTDLVINDTVPDYTSLKGSPSCGVTLSGMGCSINLSGGSQFIEWVFTGPLIGGAKSSVSYQITIDD